MAEKENLGVVSKLSLRIPVELRAKLLRLAIAEGRMVTESEMVRRLIERAPEPKDAEKRRD